MTGINTDGLSKRVWLGKLVRASSDMPWFGGLKRGAVYRVERVWTHSWEAPPGSLNTCTKFRVAGIDHDFEPEPEHIMAGSPWTFTDVASEYRGPVHGEATSSDSPGRA